MPTDINTIQAWCAIIVAITTLLTGLFIVCTFTLQAKAAMLQAKSLELQAQATTAQAQATTAQAQVTKLEFEKYLKNRNPIFSAVRKIPQTFDDGDFYNYSIIFTVTRNDIYNFRSSFRYGDNMGFVYILMEDFPKTIGSGMIEGSTLELKYRMAKSVIDQYANGPDNKKKFNFSVTFKYMDILNYNYQQQIMIHHDKEPIPQPAYIPELFEEIDAYRRKGNITK